jgi:tRNA threonylcarbamoyladenosine biosynthesis protein TsaB
MILCIESTALNCSVALFNNGHLIDFIESKDSSYSHSEKLHVFIDELFRKTGISSSDLLAVAVSSGPGSYTGLRIGVSAAKGLCYALNIPLISISTLEALAFSLEVDRPTTNLIPMIDARRREVYMQIFDSKREPKSQVEAVVLDEDFFQKCEPNTLVFGDGADKFKDIIPSHVTLLEGVFPSAVMLGKLAHEKFLQNKFEDTAYYEPFYLKEFVAGTPKKSVLD